MLSMKKLFDKLNSDEDQIATQSSIRRKRNAYAIGSKGQSALHTAAQDGNLDEVVCLLNTVSEAPYYLRDEDGNTALHLAAENGHKECVSIILNRILRDLSFKKITEEHSINAVNNIQETALHLAVKSNHYECVELLVGHIDTSIKNAEEQTALCHAVLLKKIEMVNIFIKNRCVDCDVKDENGDSVYDHIRRDDNQELIKLLLGYYVIQEREIRQKIKKSKCMEVYSEKLSRCCNRLTVLIGGVAATTTAYAEFTEDPVNNQVKRSLVKVSRAAEKLADGMRDYIKNNRTGVKKIAKGQRLAKEAAISASKVQKIITFNKGLFTIKAVGTSLSTVTCALLAPVCIFYCVSRYYKKKQTLLSNEVVVCEKRQRVLKDRCSELRQQDKNSVAKEEFLQLKNTVTELQELHSLSLKEIVSISSFAKLEPCYSDSEQHGSFRHRTRSYGEQDAKKIEQRRKPSLTLQRPRIEQPASACTTQECDGSTNNSGNCVH